MADKVWISNDGDLNASGSWSPSGAPTTGDNLIFGGGTNTNLTSNLTALASTAVQEVWVRPDFTGQFGTPGNRCDIGTIAATSIVYQGRGDAWFGGTWGPLSFTWDSDATLHTNQTTAAANMYIRRGSIIIGNGIAITGGLTVIPSGEGTSPSVLYPYDPSASVSLDGHVVAGGFVELGIQSTLLVQSGGRVLLPANAGLGTLRLHGGRCVMEQTATMTSALIYGGVLDCSTTYDAKTITTLVIGPRGDFTDSGNVTVTNLYDFRGAKPLVP